MAQLDEETKTLKGPTLNPNSDAANHQVDQHFDDAKLALQGIHMILNNEWKEAEELFMKHKLVMTHASGTCLKSGLTSLSPICRL